jgi:hypothetical protein
MMPIMKSEKQKKRIVEDKKARRNLQIAAQKGDTNAMDTLLFHEMDQYNVVMRQYCTHLDIRQRCDRSALCLDIQSGCRFVHRISHKVAV